jgi:glycine betaine/choline ABC-type transport system substrate-binding protein
VAVLVAAPVAVGAGTAVTIADTGTTTSRLTAAAASQALAAQGFAVTHVAQPSVFAADAAARAGTLDVYTTDTGVLLERVLARPKERDDAKLPPLLTSLLATRGQAALGIARYDDAPQIACTRAAVRRNRLTGVLSLPKAAPNLTYAVTAQHVIRADGLAALRSKFRRVIVSPGVGRFDLVARGRAHCVLSSGVEPRVARLPVIALRDRTRRLAGTPQHGVVVANQTYLATAPAAFAPTLDRVAALLTTDAVRALAGAVELDGKDLAVAAQELLRANGVIP